MNNRKWISTAGPIQTKKVEKAIAALRWEGNTFTELHGVHDGSQPTESTLTNIFGSPRAEVADALAAILDAHNGTITTSNFRTVIAELEAAAAAATASRPVHDKRRSVAEQEALITATTERESAINARQALEKKLRDQVVSLAPVGAHAVIIATLHEDKSDSQTDYFASADVRRVAIGFRFGKREDFNQLRRAAAAFADTAHLADDTGSRDNYSMGAGNYLGQNPNFGSGWSVRSYPLVNPYFTVTEIALPQASASAEVAAPDGVTVSPSSLGRAGVVEIRFATKPAPEVLAQLKSAGFRWARGNRCWYGPQASTPAGIGADLTGADLSGADLTGALGMIEVGQ